MQRCYVAVCALFITFFTLCVGSAYAQTVEYLNSNNINAGIGLGGNLFTNTADSPNVYSMFESPKGQGVNAIYTQAFWLTAIDGANNLHCAANTYFNYGQDFFDGPVASVYDSAYNRYYKRVWKVTALQVNQFKALAFPTTTGLVDNAILYWPGKGNTAVLNDYGVNISSTLAPFVDLNGNGVYEPLQGDYPAFCGDAAIFFVYNDIRNVHSQINGAPLGVEVRGLATCFIDSSTTLAYNKRAVNNAIFVHYEIENKSQNEYALFDVANWIDPDLGCYQNDRVGCDSLKNLVFAYNGDSIDPSCSGENGYGRLPIALGVKILNHPMSVSGYFNGPGTPQPATPDPVYPYQYRNLSEGFWPDSVPFTYGGLGYAGSDTVKYLFSGDPNIATQWSDVQSGLYEGDRKMFGSTDHLHFAVGETKHYDYAFFTSFDTTSQHLSIVDTLKKDADVIQAFYDTHIVPCQAQLAADINALNNYNQFSVLLYPNPAANTVTIEAGETISSIILMDLSGRELIKKDIEANKSTIQLAALAKGVYLMSIQVAQSTIVKRLVIE